MSIADNDFSLLTEFEPTYVRANGVKRFANLIIDNISFNIIMWVSGELLGKLFPEVVNYFNRLDPYNLWELFYSTILFSVFMGAQEIVLKGKSLGKFITQTRAINIDGSGLTSRSALLKGLSRAVPFEALSALGSPPNPWHDKWTKTMVIDEKQTAESSVNIN